MAARSFWGPAAPSPGAAPSGGPRRSLGGSLPVPVRSARAVGAGPGAPPPAAPSSPPGPGEERARAAAAAVSARGLRRSGTAATTPGPAATAPSGAAPAPEHPRPAAGGAGKVNLGMPGAAAVPGERRDARSGREGGGMEGGRERRGLDPRGDNAEGPSVPHGTPKSSPRL